MAIQTSLRTSYTMKWLAVAVVCVVFGVWGLVDYFHTIPARQRRYEQFQTFQLVRDALETDPASEGYQEALETARAHVGEQLDRLVEETSRPEEGQTVTVEQAVEAIRANNREQWFTLLLMFQASLQEARRPAQPLNQVQVQMYDIAREGVNQVGDVTPPSTFDHRFQWVYILCLPFTPYCLWMVWRRRRLSWTLDDDGALHLPDGRTWPRDQITDIDMGRWMEKSIATVIHEDGSKAPLDDYYYKDMHRIVGTLAHELHPDQWSADARPAGDETASDGGAPPDDAGPDDDASAQESAAAAGRADDESEPRT